MIWHNGYVDNPNWPLRLANMSSEQFTSAYREQAAQAETGGAWPEFWRRLADHLARFGHTIYDLDFAKAVLADDPAQVLETLKFFLSGQAPDPYERQADGQRLRVSRPRRPCSTNGVASA